MPTFEELNRAAASILAETVDKAAPDEHPARRAVVRMLRAFGKGGSDNNLFEASEKFSSFDQRTRVGIERSSLRAAEEYVERRAAERAGRGDAGASSSGAQRSAAKPGLVGILNRS